MKNMHEVLTAKIAAAALIRERGGASGPGDDLHERRQPGPELREAVLAVLGPVNGRLVALEEPEDLAALQHDRDVAVEQLPGGPRRLGGCSLPHAMSASSRPK